MKLQKKAEDSNVRTRSPMNLTFIFGHGFNKLKIDLLVAHLQQIYERHFGSFL